MIKSIRAEALGVNRKNIYRTPKREIADLKLKAEIEAVWIEHPAYGHLPLGWHLKVNHKRISRVMRKYGLKPPRRRIRHFCTVSVPHQVFPNLIKDYIPVRPNELWCADVSFIKFQNRFWYLSTIEDIKTRQILAVHVSKYHNHQLILATLKQAMIRSGELPDIFHTDQGVEYMAQAVIEFLKDNKVNISTSDKASPWQNGYQESFFGRLKDEMGDLNRFESVGEFVETIYGQIHYYNYERIHRVLRMPPAIYAQQFS